MMELIIKRDTRGLASSLNLSPPCGDAKRRQFVCKRGRGLSPNSVFWSPDRSSFADYSECHSYFDVDYGHQLPFASGN